MTAPFVAPVIPLTEPRFAGCAESHAPRGEWSAYECWWRTADGSVVDFVFARSTNEARWFLDLNGIHQVEIFDTETV